MNIDWSKAPEACLEVGKNQWDELAWLCAEGYIYHHCNGCMVNWTAPRALRRSDFDVVDIRPEHEWTGEGLPPVGAVCEYFTDGKGEHWCAAEVSYLGSHLIIVKYDHPTEGMQESCMNHTKPLLETRLRPRRTPEQIAAEEREKACEDLYLTINWNSTPSEWANLSRGRREDYFKAIDAGYRRFEIVDA